jgi:2-polyprenyl-3-methyl-5-hydroxy-6-metoxy-1,4-benzoquinol methylase
MGTARNLDESREIASAGRSPAPGQADCPGCAGALTSPSWRYKEFEIYHCHSCDLQFTHPMEAGSQSFYEVRYEDYMADAESGNVHPGYRFLKEKIDETIRKEIPGGSGRVIDIGCGAGVLLMDLQKRGLDCFGIDFNPHLVRIAREKFGLNVEMRRVEEVAAMDLRYDLALLSHVLEHVSSPLDLLRQIAVLLKSGGLLIIDVPNRLYCRQRSQFPRGELGWGEYPPHHLSFWSEKSMRTALKAAGFSVIECKARPYPEAHQARHSMVQRRGWPDNSLADIGSRILQAVGSLLGLQGATVYAIARKCN